MSLCGNKRSHAVRSFKLTVRSDQKESRASAVAMVAGSSGRAVQQAGCQFDRYDKIYRGFFIFQYASDVSVTATKASESLSPCLQLPLKMNSIILYSK